METKKNNPVGIKKSEPVSIYALEITYIYDNGRKETSHDKYCGQSEDEALATISKMLGVCRSCLPESVVQVSYTIKGYKHSSYESNSSADIIVPDVVRHVLRYNDKGCCSE